MGESRETHDALSRSLTDFFAEVGHLDRARDYAGAARLLDDGLKIIDAVLAERK